MNLITIITPSGEEWEGKIEEHIMPNLEGQFVLNMEEGFAIFGPELIRNCIVRVLPDKDTQP